MDHGRLYIVMEYVPGQDLKSIIKDIKRFSIKEGLDLIIQICMGLGYAHRAGLVHCDVKPHNMIVTPEQRLKITDFGIARALSTINPHEHADIVWGSPQYFSPEQASGMAPSPASDVYSIGIIAYEMLTGQLPFISNDINELVRMHREQQPIPPHHLNPAIPEELGLIILKVLSKEPSARYRTADQLGRIFSSFAEQNAGKIQSQPVDPNLSNTTVILPKADNSKSNNRVSVTQPHRVNKPSQAQPSTQQELPNFDWGTIGLGLLTLLVAGGLIPFWLYVWFTVSSYFH
ncbi:MAG: serine/threonine protein kinase [Anaerolineae bacterium]|nr:serine/threonine protein kinase [Anaerolineae bacterium]